MRRNRQHLWRLLAAISLVACGRSVAVQAPLPDNQLGFDLQPIDAESLATDDRARHRSLSMPFGEMGARLGSFRLDADDHLSVFEGNERLLEERVHTSIALDESGSIHLVTGGNERLLELYSIGEKAFVRLDRGKMRYKARRDVEVQEMLNAAASSLPSILTALGQAELGAANPEEQRGQSSVVYPIRQKAEALGTAPLARRPRPPGALSLPVPAEWTEHAVVKQLGGTVTIDAATGVAIRAEVHGRLELVVKGRALGIELGHRRTLHHVNDVAPLPEPADAVAEYRRPQRPREPLAFFRDHLETAADGSLIDRPLPPPGGPAAGPARSRPRRP